MKSRAPSAFPRFSVTHALIAMSVVAMFAAALANPSPLWASRSVMVLWFVYSSLACMAIAGHHRKMICGALVFGISYVALAFVYDHPHRSIQMPTSLWLWELYDAVHGRHAAVANPSTPGFPWRESFIEIGQLGISLVAALVGAVITSVVISVGRKTPHPSVRNA